MTERNHLGHWLKGVSGNPEGRPKNTIEAYVRRVLQEDLPEEHPSRALIHGEIREDASKLEAVARLFVDRLLLMDPKAMRLYLEREWAATQRVRVESNPDAERAELAQALENLSDEDLAVLARVAGLVELTSQQPTGPTH